jgi:hypothetical protein
MYQRFEIDPGPQRRLSNQARGGATHLNVVVVDNKRADLNLPAVVSALQHSLPNTCKITFLKWEGPEKYHEFGNLLRLLQNTDIYVSGIGTGMMWFPLIRSGSVVVSLGDIRAGGVRPIVTHHHVVDHMMASHVRVLYYDSDRRWNGVAAEEVVRLVDRAAALINSGFKLPVSMEDNSDASGRAFLRLCMSDQDQCRRLLAMSGGVLFDCTDARYVQEIMWGWGRWDKGGECASAVPLNFDLIYSIRKELSQNWPSLVLREDGWYMPTQHKRRACDQQIVDGKAKMAGGSCIAVEPRHATAHTMLRATLEKQGRSTEAEET